MQVKHGDVGSLPVKLFVDMSNNLQPLFREWRARIWSLGRGGRHTPSTQRLTAGPTTQFSLDSDDDGSLEPRVSAAVAAAFTHAGGIAPAPLGAPVFVERDASGAGAVMRAGASAPARNAWGVQHAAASVTAKLPASDIEYDDATADLSALHGRVYANGAQVVAASGVPAPMQVAETAALLHKAKRARADLQPVAEVAAHDGGAAYTARADCRSDEDSLFAAARSAMMPNEGALRNMITSGLSFDGLGLRLFGRH